MKAIADDNNAKNKGAAIFVNKKFSITKLEEINEISKEIDASWGLAVVNRTRYIMGSVYVKDNYPNAINDVIKMLDKAHSLIRKLKAVGIILSGGFNARHTSWGYHKPDSYGNNSLLNWT